MGFWCLEVAEAAMSFTSELLEALVRALTFIAFMSQRQYTREIQRVRLPVVWNSKERGAEPGGQL